MFGYDNLKNFYSTNFALVQHHKYSLTELENMLPWERDVYIEQLRADVEKEKTPRFLAFFHDRSPVQSRWLVPFPIRAVAVLPEMNGTRPWKSGAVFKHGQKPLSP